MSVAPFHSERRVVITGIGVVAPNGIGKDAFWKACLAGASGIRRITRFDASPIPSQIAGEVVDFVPERFGLTPDEIHDNGRGVQFGLASATLALQDAGLDMDTLSQYEHERIGVYMGVAMANNSEGEQLWVKLTERGTQKLHMPAPGEMCATQFLMHASAQSIAAKYRCHGPVGVISTGCSASSDAIGQAFWAIQEGRADRMLAGGCDSALSPVSLGVFCVIGAISTHHNDEPTRASRPYDAKRDGFVMGEGAAVLLLEEREMALARGAPIYAELLSFVSNCNAYHMTALPDDGRPLQQLFQQLLAETQLVPSDLGYINSHGSSTMPNDRAETAAYKAIFGEMAAHIPISATKSMIGHTQGAAGAIEAVVTALVIAEQWIPPTINLIYPDPQCDLDYVPNVARQTTINVALTHSSGFGGVNSALVMVRPDWIETHDK